MKKPEFDKLWQYLIANCAPLEREKVQGRMEAFWLHLQAHEAIQVRQAIDWHLKQPGSKYFPTVGEIMEALYASGELVDERVRDTTDPETMHLYRRYRQDPEFRKEIDAANEAWGREMQEMIKTLPPQSIKIEIDTKALQLRPSEIRAINGEKHGSRNLESWRRTVDAPRRQRPTRSTRAKDQ